MAIDYSQKFFRDVAVGSEELNEYKNKSPQWKDPNGDRLILDVIDQVCTFNS